MEAPWRYLEVWETSSWFSRNYNLRYLAGGLAESHERRDAWCYSGPGGGGASFNMASVWTSDPVLKVLLPPWLWGMTVHSQVSQGTRV